MASAGIHTPRAQDDDLLARPLQYVKGVGPKRAELLSRLFLEKLSDLLYFFPIAHKDRAHATPFDRLRTGTEANVRGQVIDMTSRRMANGRELVIATLQDEEGRVMEALWFNPYIGEKLPPYSWCFFSGKVVSGKRGQTQLQHPDFEVLSIGDPKGEDTPPEGGPTSPDFGRIVPIYSLRPKQRRPDGSLPPEVKLTQAFIRRLVWTALEEGGPERLRDDLPADVRAPRKLLTLAEAIRGYHFPASMDQIEHARRRLAYEELFMVSLGVALRRAQIEQQKAARRLPLTAAIQERITARLPFQLTAAQARAFREVSADLGGARPMNRLLQGDVGSGKTAVALAAILLGIAHKAQAALLAPTEVLAEQHLRTFTKLLEGSRVRIGLLRGGAAAGERKAFLDDLARGEIHLAIGTHALLEPDIAFQDLALVVVDEQHKFGVEQRRALRGKGAAPHVLVMTATPIPRSLGLTLYGDLDLSIIDQMPPGREEVVTRWVKEADRPKVCRRILDEARKGHATYVVLPRIEGDELPPDEEGASKKRAPKKLWSEVKGVEAEVKRLREHLPTLRIESLHGRMKGEQKDGVLAKLREGQLDVLVSTQVIEVGIDLPKATVMLIENAEMFGLSSLHQLRGRVGRGGLKGWCLFFGEPSNDEAKERLKTFANTLDGFQIAEADFRLRGPGRFFGTEQTGLPEFLVADLIRDQRLLLDARDDAFALVRADPGLQKSEHEGLSRRVQEVFRKPGRLGLVDVG